MTAEFPKINKNSEFYMGCKKKRDNGYNLCGMCPFRSEIERQELSFNESDSFLDGPKMDEK